MNSRSIFCFLIIPNIHSYFWAKNRKNHFRKNFIDVYRKSAGANYNWSVILIICCNWENDASCDLKRHSDAWKLPKGMRKPWSKFHPIGVYQNWPSNNIFIASGWLNVSLFISLSLFASLPRPISCRASSLLESIPALARVSHSPFHRAFGPSARK